MTEPGDLDDQELMRRMAAGESGALEALYQKHHKGLARFLFRMSGDSHLVDELLQESFLSVWRSASRWRPEAKVRTYLYTIARNAFLNSRRHKRDVPIAETEAGSAPEPSEPLERAEEAAAVRRALDALDESDREVLLLVLEEGLKYEEAAGVLGVPVGTVKSRIHRALAKVKKILGDPP